jgi:hypothetical protein
MVFPKSTHLIAGGIWWVPYPKTFYSILVDTLKTGYPRIQALSQGKEQGVYPHAATQAVAPGLASLLRWASGHHVPYCSSSRCPTQGSSGATTCPAAPAPAAQPGAALGPPRMP